MGNAFIIHLIAWWADRPNKRLEMRCAAVANVNKAELAGGWDAIQKRKKVTS